MMASFPTEENERRQIRNTGKADSISCLNNGYSLSEISELAGLLG